MQCIDQPKQQYKCISHLWKITHNNVIFYYNTNAVWAEDVVTSSAHSEESQWGAGNIWLIFPLKNTNNPIIKRTVPAARSDRQTDRQTDTHTRFYVLSLSCYMLKVTSGYNDCLLQYGLYNPFLMWLHISVNACVSTYIASLEELTVILAQVHWECMEGQGSSHVDITLFLDWQSKNNNTNSLPAHEAKIPQIYTYSVTENGFTCRCSFNI